MALDTKQQEAVNELNNVVVSAGAGSGKTTVLSQRFSKLIETDKIAIDKILTLTFTNKAATEMKARIFNTLKEHSEKNIYAKSAIKQFDKTHIQTLDSYFSEVAKQGAHFYGITPSFSLDNNKINKMITTRALQFILTNKNNTAIKEMTKTTDIESLAKNLFAATVLEYSSIVTPLDFKTFFENQNNAIVLEWNKIILSIEKSKEKILYIIESIKKASKTILKLKDAIDITEKWNERELTEENISNYIKSYYDFANTTKPSRSEEARKIALEYENIIQQLKFAIAIANFIHSKETTKELFNLLTKFQKEVIETKRTSGILTFSDVAHLAKLTLQEHDDIRHMEQKKYSAIMIDEFQDDDQNQCDVLFMLSDKNEKFDKNNKYIIPNFDSNSENYIKNRLEEKKLFFVGDEKQSIYSFRNADVTVFRNLQEHLGKKIYLATNYRSKAGLIKAFNNMFGGDNERGKTAIFMTNENNDTIPSYEARYEKVEIPKSKQNDTTENPLVKIVFTKKINRKTNDNTSASDIVNEANWVSSEIKRLVKDEGYKYSDIALLFRTSSQLKYYEKSLLKAQIPYSTEVFKGFFSDGPINDLVSYLKICAYPEDSNAFSEVLCSAFVNLKRVDMEILMAAIKKEKASQEKDFAPFDDDMMELAAIVFNKDSDTYEHLEEAKKIFLLIKKSLKTESLTKTISRLWYDAGYRYETLWNNDVNMYTSLYDILFELARRAEAKAQNLAQFIDEIETYKDDSEKIEGLDLPFEANDSVKIMTIHKSKGLEFKVVFVCSINSHSQQKKNSCIAFCNNSYGIALITPASQVNKTAPKKINENENMNFFEIEAREVQDNKEAAELRRLTYVAFTRAEEKLYIVGSAADNFAEDEEKVYEFTPGKIGDKVIGRELFYQKPKKIYDIILPVLIANTYTKEITNENGENIKERVCNENAVFSFKMIDNFSENISENKNFRQNGAKEKKSFIENKTIEALYNLDKKNVIKEEYVKPTHITPSKLEDKSHMHIENFGIFPYSEIDEIVKSTAIKDESKIDASEKETTESSDIYLEDLFYQDSYDNNDNEEITGKYKFSLNKFGTLAHSYIEYAIKHKGKLTDENNKISFIEKKLIEGLDDDENKINKIKDICKKMTEDFLNTKEGKEALTAPFVKSEYNFKSFVDNIIVNGTIDLIYENTNKDEAEYTIIDFKSDHYKTPDKYYSQLACYRQAIAFMMGVDFSKIKCKLYYLRYNEIIDITNKCDENIIKTKIDSQLADYKKQWEEAQEKL